ncbi:unnamed protein product [Rotaria socialis]
MSKVAVDLNHRHGIPLKALEIKHFCTDLETIFNERYTSTLSYLDIYRIRKDIKFIHSIKRKLRKTDSIIRVTDKSGIFHIGSTLDYDEKYKDINLLNNLRTKQQITQWQHTKMMPDKNKIQLAYLYFIPKPHKTGTPLRPIVSGMNTPTTKISKMLDRLIRPLFDQYVKQPTIIDGVHLIRQLDKCVSLGLLKPTTHLCTFDITDLYTMLPQEESIAILKQFLIRFNQTHTRGMSINTIESLARIVLTETYLSMEINITVKLKGVQWDHRLL